VLAALGAMLALVAGAAPTAQGKSCPDLENAIHIEATGPLSCRLVGVGIEIYQGAPVGCVEGPRCGQSGISPAGALMYAACRRHDLRVGCTIGVRGRTHRWAHSKVRFTMVRDPYGCPDDPVCS
jgi:hypothetical protein